MMFLKQNNSAEIFVTLIDSVDGKTLIEEVTLGDITAAIYKGSTRSALTLTAENFVYIADGIWKLSLSADDTDTVGRLKITLRDDDVFLLVNVDYEVLPEAVYDSQFGTGNLAVKLDAMLSAVYKTAVVYEAGYDFFGYVHAAQGVYINDNNIINGRDSYRCISFEQADSAILFWDGEKYIIETYDMAGITFTGGVNIVGTYTAAGYADIEVRASYGVLGSSQIPRSIWDRSIHSLAYTTTNSIGKYLANAAQAGEAAAAIEAAGLSTEANATANKNTIVSAISDKPVTPVTDISGLATKEDIDSLNDISVNDIEQIITSGRPFMR